MRALLWLLACALHCCAVAADPPTLDMCNSWEAKYQSFHKTKFEELQLDLQEAEDAHAAGVDAAGNSIQDIQNELRKRAAPDVDKVPLHRFLPTSVSTLCTPLQSLILDIQ